ncbi:hypothetical protein [uncultured Campylobacter sp.]|uniref:hypothetical protein n=1 Tax=uncultured Campylobacter sp. TaxID=218934 RepID=UPI00262A22A4|nr:hypothetical protein [uncultured Campylobacter sp.]
MKFLKFLGARCFGSRAAELLKFTSKLRNEFGILKFMRASAPFADTAQNFIPQRGLRISKLICELPSTLRRVLPSADVAEAGHVTRLTSQHAHDAIEKRRAVKFNHAGGYLNSAWRYIARFCSAAARHGYEVGRTEKFSKFSLTNALLNSISLPPRKFKLTLLKFTPEVPRNISEILNFMPELRKFKSASAVRLNFAFNSVPRARAAKVENGVKFEGAAKFKRGVR